jgi:hypothetical protein
MNTRRNPIGMIVALFILATGSLLSQGIPQTMSFQGYVTTSGGTPLTGTQTVTFKLVDANSGNDLNWSETRSIDFSSGLFSTILGSSNPLNLPFDRPYTLVVSINGNEVSRMPLTSAPYALRARYADNAPSGPVSDGSVTTPKLADGSVTSPKLADGSVTSSKIAAGQVVRSINGLHDDMQITAGAGVQVVPSGNGLMISANVTGQGDITAVRTSNGLSGGGESGDVTLGIANGGVTNAMIAGGAITTDKISTAGASSGQFLMNSGGNAAWGTPTATLNLPYTGTLGGSTDPFSIYSTGSGDAINGYNGGTGRAGWFEITNASSTAPVVEIRTNGSPTGGTSGALMVTNGGSSGHAGFFTNSNSSNSNAALVSISNGNWQAANFQINNSSNSQYAVVARSNGSGGGLYSYMSGTGTGARVEIDNTSSSGDGIFVTTNGSGNAGRFAISSSGSSADAFEATTAGTGRAGYFAITNSGSSSIGLQVANAGTGDGLHAEGYQGVEGYASVYNGNGTAGIAPIGGNAWGIYGSSTSGWAGVFSGNVSISGSLSASTKNFRIDHPLDPANKYLYHTSIESPNMLNIYDGVVTLDARGVATVVLPEYMQALNGEFRYQLTCVGGYAPVYVGEEIHENRFTIAGGRPGLKVSWQVTGIRHDAYATAHPSPVEVEKPAAERGFYIHPELFGQPAEKSIEWAQKPELMARIREHAERTAAPANTAPQSPRLAPSSVPAPSSEIGPDSQAKPQDPSMSKVFDVPSN